MNCCDIAQGWQLTVKITYVCTEYIGWIRYLTPEMTPEKLSSVCSPEWEDRRIAYNGAEECGGLHPHWSKRFIYTGTGRRTPHDVQIRGRFTDTGDRCKWQKKKKIPPSPHRRSGLEMIIWSDLCNYDSLPCDLWCEGFGYRAKKTRIFLFYFLSTGCWAVNLADYRFRQPLPQTEKK